MAQYDIDGCRDLVIAIVEQGVEDVLKGDPGAIAWFHSRDFDHYCAWIDIDPAAARDAIAARRVIKEPKYKETDLQQIKHLHDHGLAWRYAIIRVFGYYSETARAVVSRYVQQTSG